MTGVGRSAVRAVRVAEQFLQEVATVRGFPRLLAGLQERQDDIDSVIGAGR